MSFVHAISHKIARYGYKTNTSNMKNQYFAFITLFKIRKTWTGCTMGLFNGGTDSAE